MQYDVKLIRETNAFSCLECGKCTGTCPVARYSHTFSPRHILSASIHNSHPDTFPRADLWSCLTCKRCDEVCPSDIKYIDFIQLIRQFQGVENREGTCSHGGILEAISRIMMAPDLKQQRLSGLNSGFQTSNTSDYLYFMGCLPYFDVLFSDLNVNALNVARNTLKILNYLDIKPQLLADEKCCGHDAYWNGDMNTFQTLALANLEQIKKSKAKNIITACPECYRTLKIDYPKYFGKQDFQVQHISEFLSGQISGLKLKAERDTLKVTFQDPCRLGRHLNIYEPPREALKSINGVDLIEMGHHHKRAVCCGVSGWMNCSQVSKQIQSNRLMEAQASGADVMVTTCAKCKIHFSCALEDEKLKEAVTFEIKDLTEVIGESLQ
jgi:heterodisulfide reductase subunit D